jgi:hypothetical protein
MANQALEVSPSSKNMKSKSLIRDNHIYKSLLIVPVTLIAFSACSNVPGTTQDRPTTGYGPMSNRPNRLYQTSVKNSIQIQATNGSISVSSLLTLTVKLENIGPEIRQRTLDFPLCTDPL